MSRFFNSLQTQLFLVLIVFVLMLSVAIYLNLQIGQEAKQRITQVDVIGLQRSNAYLLASYARRLVNASDDTIRQSVRGITNDAIDNARAIQQGLRTGDENLALQPIESPSLLLLVDDLDQEWAKYLGMIEALLATNDNTEQARLLERIDNESVTVFTLADRLVVGLNFSIDQQQQTIQQISIFIGLLALFTVGFAVLIVVRIVRSISRLSQTAQVLAKGDLSARAPEEGVVEISGLGRTFNSMATDIQNRISETETARQRAERSDQVKSAFLASMSHELRTPLNAIINFTKFVAKGDLGEVNEEQEQALYEVIDSAKHLLNLINDVLDMSKIESGSLNLFVIDKVDMKAILQQVITTGKSLLTDKPVEIHADIAEDLPTIRGDRQRLVQIFLNVISNACKFTEAGSITIKAYRRHEEVVISVADTGPGIAPEDQEAVFEAFKQTDTGLRQGGGTGLGMPITKSLVEAHGGHLKLDSQLNEGATFTIVLPIAASKLVATLI